MTQAGTVAAAKLLGRLQDPAGLQQKIGQIAEVAAFELPLVEFDHIQTRNIGADVLEKSTAFKYPVVLVYAERIKNKQTEKFRRFSGQVDLVVEMRHPGQMYMRAAGSLGWSFPAAIGAKAAAPQRTVVCFTGADELKRMPELFRPSPTVVSFAGYLAAAAARIDSAAGLIPGSTPLAVPYP